MYLSLSQYIATLAAEDEDGTKQAKIKALRSYYEKYSEGIIGQELPLGVIYARYSSHNQREESIEDQVLDCLRCAAAKGVMIVGVYFDKAIPGKTDDRAGFQQMLHEVGKKPWKILITWKTDRFARNKYDSVIYKHRIKKAGVKIFYAKEDIPDGPEGIILESMLEGIAEYYSVNLSENVKRGCRGNAMDAKSNGQRPAFGIRVNDKRQFEPDPDTNSAAAHIFQMAFDDRPYSEICEWLNSRGYLTTAGKKFIPSAIGRILRNPVYIGTYTYADIVIENAFPATISRELWDGVQEKTGRRSKLHGKKKNYADFLLTTKAFCGLCGSPIVGTSGSGRNKSGYYYYGCMGRLRGQHGNGCRLRNLRKEYLEDLVVDTAQALIDDPENFDFLVQVCLEAQARENDTSNLENLSDQLREVNKSIDNLVNAIAEGGMAKAMKEKLSSLEERRVDLEAAIAEEQMVKPIFSEADIRFLLSRFQNGDTADPQYRQSIIDILVNAVYVYDEKIVIVFNFTDGPDDRITLRQVEKALEDAAFADDDTEAVRMMSPQASQNRTGRSCASPFDFCFETRDLNPGGALVPGGHRSAPTDAAAETAVKKSCRWHIFSEERRDGYCCAAAVGEPAAAQPLVRSRQPSQPAGRGALCLFSRWFCFGVRDLNPGKPRKTLAFCGAVKYNRSVREARAIISSGRMLSEWKRS